MTQKEKELLQLLEQKENALEKVKKEFEEIIYIISHDLQQPVTTLLGYVELIRNRYYGQLDEKANTYLDQVSFSVDKLTHLLQSLLNYSRIGRYEVVKEMDFNQCLDKTLSSLTMSIEKLQPVFHIDKLPTLPVKKFEIQILFKELIENALKFSREGISPHIYVNLVEDLPTHYHLSISDNGIGIDPAYHEQVFDVHFRSPDHQHIQGYGMGLAICKRVVESHKGEISLTSTVNKGTTIYFSLCKNLTDSKQANKDD